MDHNALEKERGITIFSKCAGIVVPHQGPDGVKKNIKINLVDTPGHADFGGEVERVLSMVDGVVLLVDANEGPMAQTKYVLRKALSRGLKAVVVFNKVDRGLPRLETTEMEVLELFSALSANEDQLSYPSLYASAKLGWALNCVKGVNDIANVKGTMAPLFDAIINYLPAPVADRSKPFQMLVTQLEPNAFLGKCLVGRIHSGKVTTGDFLRALKMDSSLRTEARILKLFVRHGLDQVCVGGL